RVRLPGLRQYFLDCRQGRLAVQNLARSVGGCQGASGQHQLRYLRSRVDPHLGTSNIEHELDITLNHIPYKGDGPMLADLLSDRLEFGAVLASSITGQIQSGRLRLL